jgi:hypothetical protein
MPRRAITFGMPVYSFIPTGLGILMLWVLITVFNLLGYSQCAGWKSIQPAPMGEVRVIGASKNDIYVQTPDGTLYCSTQNSWKKCKISTFVFSHKDAPLWFSAAFKFIPEAAAAAQITRAGNDYQGYSNVVLLENRHIWVCPYSLQAEIDELVSSGTVIWLVLPAVIGVGCVVWFFMIFAKFGSPTVWDFSGRGTKVK